MITDELKQQVCDLIKEAEGIKLKAYYDTAGIITIGVGLARKYPNGTPIQDGDTCTAEQAYEWLNYHLEQHVYPAVSNLQQQYGFNDKVFCALCSFAYNLGAGALNGNSIKSAFESGDLDQLADAFRKYVKAGGVVIKGLQNRRELEINYFMGE